MIPYDSSHDPPAIVLSVSLTGVVNRRRRVDVPALIDTGADVTAVPEMFMERLKLYPVGRIFIEDANGVMTPGFTYDAFLSLPEEQARIMEVVLTPYPFVILGRDWLKGYYVLLDGPGQQFDLRSEPIRIQEN
ncbi:MAG: retropepsin-like aspartic protease [Candidatus Promineifilaceae bacterium]